MENITKNSGIKVAKGDCAVASIYDMYATGSLLLLL